MNWYGLLEKIKHTLLLSTRHFTWVRKFSDVFSIYRSFAWFFFERTIWTFFDVIIVNLTSSSSITNGIFIVLLRKSRGLCDKWYKSTITWYFCVQILTNSYFMSSIVISSVASKSGSTCAVNVFLPPFVVNGFCSAKSLLGSGFILSMNRFSSFTISLVVTSCEYS